MIDYAKISVKAGDGGNGSGSFRHIKGKRHGRADGGNGGNGGNVYFEASRDLNTLENYRFLKSYKAEGGADGFSNLRRGGDGHDLILKVPVGTQIEVDPRQNSSEDQPRSTPSNDEDEPTHNLKSNIYDLTEHGQRVLVARAGSGGRGNSHLRDEFGRRPRTGERGTSGETIELTLELKLIADIGIIGLPNAGKSTLLSKLTNAHPAIANYPFTTLEPNLGVLSRSSERSTINDLRLVMADIPGLIEGASEGRGLGYLFLRHIERTKLLLHLIDVSVIAVELIWNNYQTIRNELKTFNPELVAKKEIVVLTKIDLAESKKVGKALSLFKEKKKKVVAISANTDEGINKLIKILSTKL